jgi:hypothetical protein
MARGKRLPKVLEHVDPGQNSYCRISKAHEYILTYTDEKIFIELHVAPLRGGLSVLWVAPWCSVADEFEG